MEKEIAGKVVLVNEEGYLIKFEHWEKCVGECIAEEHNIVLSERHWEVITYLQDEHKNNVPLSIRRISKSAVVNVKEFYQLFPQGPLKTATKIAGIPKPTSCL
jgi:tRNA 2-thiouridine synthesizing protein E